MTIIKSFSCATLQSNITHVQAVSSLEFCIFFCLAVKQARPWGGGQRDTQSDDGNGSGGVAVGGGRENTTGLCVPEVFFSDFGRLGPRTESACAMRPLGMFGRDGKFQLGRVTSTWCIDCTGHY